MIIKSKNFHIVLWNWDMLCMWDVQTNYNEKTNEYPRIINNEDFLITVANFAVNLAEENFKKSPMWLKKAKKIAQIKREQELANRLIN